MAFECNWSRRAGRVLIWIVYDDEARTLSTVDAVYPEDHTGLPR